MATSAMALAIVHAGFTMRQAVRRIQKIRIDRTTDKEFSLNMDGSHTGNLLIDSNPSRCCEE
jgi:hypothetical protein